MLPCRSVCTLLGIVLLVTLAPPGGSSSTNNLRFLSFYGNGNAEQATEDDLTALAWRDHRLKCMLTVDWIWTHALSALNASLVEATPLIAEGGLGVVFLGDEPHIGSQENLARVANAARSSLNHIHGGQNVLIYMNHCGGGLKKYGINQIPGAIDVMSLDGYCVYHLSDPQCEPGDEAHMMRGIYEHGLLPKMLANQSLFVVPGMFNAGNMSGHSLAAQQAAMAQKLRGYVQWANEEPRIIGLFPWHLEDFCATSNPPEYCLGAKHFAGAMDVIKQIGHNISSPGDMAA